MQISQFDEVPEDYAKALDAADTLQALRDTVARYELVAGDAVDTAKSLDEDGFAAWRKALKKERRGKFMGDELAERFGALLMPEAMLKVTVVANQFQVPWGLAYHRLDETGRVTIKNGRAVVNLD